MITLIVLLVVFLVVLLFTLLTLRAGRYADAFMAEELQNHIYDFLHHDCDR